MKIKCCKAPNLKLTKKFTLILSAVLAAILVAGIILCAVLGFNSSIKDQKTLTVSMYSHNYEAQGNEIQGVVNAELGKVGLEADDVNIGTVGKLSTEIVYVFDKDTSEETLYAVKDALDVQFAGEFIDVLVQDVEIISTTAKNYVGRGLIALLIFAVASLVYVWIRHKLFAALYVLGGNLLSMGLTTAIIALTRIPVTPSVAAAIAGSVLFSTVAILMFFNKLRAAQAEDGAAEKSTEELLSSSIAWKETTVFASLMTVALIVMICVGRAAIAWFSLAAIIGVLVAAVIGLLLVPAAFVPAKKCADKIAAAKSTSYKGAKKGEKAKKADNEEIVD